MSGFESIRVHYWWSRAKTSLLGPLSPSYIVSGWKRGPREPGNFRLVRPIIATAIPNLLLDEACPFREMAQEQLSRITAYFRDHPPGRESVERGSGPSGCGVGQR
jgi:hypothetical protein